MKVYITFGFDHVHAVNGKTFDHNCVAVIESNNEEEGRTKAFEYFNDKWCMSYDEDHWTEDHMKYYPRGCINVGRDIT